MREPEGVNLLFSGCKLPHPITYELNFDLGKYKMYRFIFESRSGSLLTCVRRKTPNWEPTDHVGVHIDLGQ